MKIASLLLISLSALIIAFNCYAFESTEAQRQYDLAVSYIKSDLYIKGLETLNQVAFLYPDSDVADDALYQLAMIREQVGDGKLKIGEQKSLEAVRTELNNLTGRLTTDILVSINAYFAGEAVLSKGKDKAIAQYILALDYLNTLTQRYPDSDRLSEIEASANRIINKIDTIISKDNSSKDSDPEPSYTRNIRNKFLEFFGAIIAFFAIIALLGALNK